MEVKSANGEMSAKPFSVVRADNLTTSPLTTRTSTTFADRQWDGNTRNSVTPIRHFIQNMKFVCFLCNKKHYRRRSSRRSKWHDRFTSFDQEKPENFRVLHSDPEQSKFTTSVDTAILKMMPKCGLHLTTYLNELLRTNETKQHSRVGDHSGQTEDHTALKTRMPEEVYEFKEKERSKPKDNIEAKNCAEHFVWLTHCLLKPRYK